MNMILSLQEAADILRKGGVVAFPTETVYGLGAVATNPQAVRRVYQIKQRPPDNPLICHFWSPEHIQEYAGYISNLTSFLIAQLTPGPVSFLIDLPPNSPLLPATCGLSSMLARIPNQPLTLSLIEQVGQPIAGPSANTSGKFSGTNVDMIMADLGDKIDGVVDGGPASIGLESTILDARSEEAIVILRHGGIGQRELENLLAASGVFAKVTIYDGTQATIIQQRTIPGSKYRHYAPRTPLVALDTIHAIPHEPDSAVLVDYVNYQKLLGRGLRLINLGQDTPQIARNLYASLFQLDQLQVRVGYLVWPSLDDSSLAVAIREKLQKIVG